MEAVGRTFRQLWCPTSGFKIRNLDNHIILFVFQNGVDVDRVLQSEPWCFEKHLVVMKKYEGDGSIQEIPFNEASFWVQVHDIPIRFMNKTVAESICESVGKMSRTIDGADEEGGSFMRVKVRSHLDCLF